MNPDTGEVIREQPAAVSVVQGRIDACRETPKMPGCEEVIAAQSEIQALRVKSPSLGDALDVLERARRGEALDLGQMAEAAELLMRLGSGRAPPMDSWLRGASWLSCNAAEIFWHDGVFLKGRVRDIALDTNGEVLLRCVIQLLLAPGVGAGEEAKAPDGGAPLPELSVRGE